MAHGALSAAGGHEERCTAQVYKGQRLPTGLEAFFPLPVFGTSVHISLTFSWED